MHIYNFNTNNNRKSSLDIIRIVAVLSVVFVHFFLMSGFYDQKQIGGMYIFADVLRSIAGVCVPLFMILTGYLMNKRTISKKHYKGLSKVLLVYLFACFAAIIFRYIYFNRMHQGSNTVIKNPWTAILEIFSFKASPNAWYIEMYIGLFLLIPFLNIIWNNLESKKKKQLLVLTTIALSILPSLLNIHVLSDLSWWTHPTANVMPDKLIPAFFVPIYPITYYFVGCYLCEYQNDIRIKTRTLIVLFISCSILFGLFHYYRSAGQIYDTGEYGKWSGFDPFVLSVLLFMILSRVKTDGFSYRVKHILHVLSELTLHVYLLSYIFDNLYYDILKRHVTTFKGRFMLLPVMILAVYLSSLILAFFVEAIKNVIIGFIKKIFSRK